MDRCPRSVVWKRKRRDLPGLILNKLRVHSLKKAEKDQREKKSKEPAPTVEEKEIELEADQSRPKDFSSTGSL